MSQKQIKFSALLAYRGFLNPEVPVLSICASCFSEENLNIGGGFYSFEVTSDTYFSHFEFSNLKGFPTYEPTLLSTDQISEELSIYKVHSDSIEVKFNPNKNTGLVLFGSYAPSDRYIRIGKSDLLVSVNEAQQLTSMVIENVVHDPGSEELGKWFDEYIPEN